MTILGLPMLRIAVVLLSVIGFTGASTVSSSETDGSLNTDLQVQGFVYSLELAIEHDPSLKHAYATYLAEQEDDDLSYAQLLPQVSFSGAYQYEKSDNIYTDVDSDFYNPDLARSSGELLDSYWRFDVQQSLIDYEAREAYKRDLAGVKASEYRYQRAIQEVTYQVAERYLRVLLLAQRVFLTDQKLEALQLKAVQAERSNELGVGDPLTILRVKASRDLARSDLLQAQSELNDAKTLLKNITGTEVNLPFGWVKGAQNIQSSLLNDFDENWLAKIQNNLTLLETQQKIEQEKRNLASQKASRYPKVTLNFRHLNKSSEDDFRERNDSVVTLQLNMPIYNGGRQSALTRKAEARLQASQAELDVIRSEKTQQVELSINKISSIAERLNALEDSRKSSQGYLEAAERQMSLNLGDQIAVLDARTDLVDTQLKFAQSLHDYLMADLVLRLETGQLSVSRLSEYDRLYSSAAAM